MNRVLNCVFLCFILVSVFPSAVASGFWVRDSWNGQPVAATVKISEIQSNTLTSEQWQMVRSGQWHDSKAFDRVQTSTFLDDYIALNASDKLQLIAVENAEFWPQHTWLEPFQTVQLTTVWLQPKQKQRCPHQTICGFVIDAVDYSALSGAEVQLQQQIVTTDNRGFFMLELTDPTAVELMVSSQQRQSQRLQLEADAQGMHMIIELSAGSGVQTRDMRHPLQAIQSGLIDNHWQLAKLQQQPTVFNGALRERAGGAVYIQPPLSIRVGFDNAGGYCCGNGCATSQVFSLEQYVQRGLDNEWISSWDSDSLKAGSIPFRS